MMEVEIVTKRQVVLGTESTVGYVPGSLLITRTLPEQAVWSLESMMLSVGASLFICIHTAQPSGHYLEKLKHGSTGGIPC